MSMPQFWSKWLALGDDTVAREDLLEKLPCFSNGHGEKQLYAKHLTITTLNSYLESVVNLFPHLTKPS